MEVVKRSHEICHIVPAHSQKGTNESGPAESMVSVSRIILLQSSGPWRACEKRPSKQEIDWRAPKKIGCGCPAPKGASDIDEERHRGSDALIRDPCSSAACWN